MRLSSFRRSRGELGVNPEFSDERTTVKARDADDGLERFLQAVHRFAEVDDPVLQLLARRFATTLCRDLPAGAELIAQVDVIDDQVAEVVRPLLDRPVLVHCADRLAAAKSVSALASWWMPCLLNRIRSSTSQQDAAIGLVVVLRAAVVGQAAGYDQRVGRPHHQLQRHRPRLGDVLVRDDLEDFLKGLFLEGPRCCCW